MLSLEKTLLRTSLLAYYYHLEFYLYNFAISLLFLMLKPCCTVSNGITKSGPFSNVEFRENPFTFDATWYTNRTLTGLYVLITVNMGRYQLTPSVFVFALFSMHWSRFIGNSGILSFQSKPVTNIRPPRVKLIWVILIVDDFSIDNNLC